MSIRRISASEFTADVITAKLTKDELAAKYELPKTEIGRILKKLNLRIARKQHQTYLLEDDRPAHVTQGNTSLEPVPDNLNESILSSSPLSSSTTYESETVQSERSVL